MPTDNTFFHKDTYDNDIRLDINEDVLERIYSDNIKPTDELNVNFAFITAPTTQACRHQSICKQGRFAKDIYFALQMRRNIVSLFKRFGRRVFQIRTSSSCKPLCGIVSDDKRIVFETFDLRKEQLINFTYESKSISYPTYKRQLAN